MPIVYVSRAYGNEIHTRVEDAKNIEEDWGSMCLARGQSLCGIVPHLRPNNVNNSGRWRGVL